MLNEVATKQLFTFGDELVAQIRRLILQLWGNSELSVEIKDDQSPVTSVDKEAEELARDIINQSFPSHGVVGEEYGSSNPGSEFQWTIDPIDGTQNLVNRILTFGTLIGLRYRGEPILGYIDHPVLGAYCKGGAALGAFYNGAKVALPASAGGSATLSINDVIATSSYATFGRGGHHRALLSILDFHQHTRIYYDCYAHTLTVAGGLAATVEFNLKVWDLTPAEALLKAAGGVFIHLGQDKPGEKMDWGSYHAVFGRRGVAEAIAQHLDNHYFRGRAGTPSEP
jgi:fructose-1,6-bisphosphatase/inositol monophosphatase family enzyme